MHVAQPGRGIGHDISKGEGVEHELNAFITKRHNDRVSTEGERGAVDLWRESEKRTEAVRLAEEGRSRLQLCRHLQDVYLRRSEEWGRLGDELEGAAI